MVKRCFFDIAIDAKPVGRLVFELYDQDCPKTVENFRALCTGEKGFSRTAGTPLHFKGCKFHRIIKNFMLQSGDFTRGDGTGGESIYGKRFEDENFVHKHKTKGVLAMANAGANTNGSQFYIVTAANGTPHLDGKHVVFGKVISGMHLIDILDNVKTDSNDKPFSTVEIEHCGELVKKKKTNQSKKRKLLLKKAKKELCPKATVNHHRRHHRHRRRNLIKNRKKLMMMMLMMMMMSKIKSKIKQLKRKKKLMMIMKKKVIQNQCHQKKAIKNRKKN